MENGKIVKIRKTTSPNAEQSAIYQALGLAPPPAKTEKNVSLNTNKNKICSAPKRIFNFQLIDLK